jgi:hypothetical protein
MADDVVQVQSTGSLAQNIDNSAVTRPDGVLVDRQRIVLEDGDTFEQAPPIERLLSTVIELLMAIQIELRVHSMLLHDLPEKLANETSDGSGFELNLDELREDLSKDRDTDDMLQEL